MDVTVPTLHKYINFIDETNKASNENNNTNSLEKICMVSENQETKNNSCLIEENVTVQESIIDNNVGTLNKYTTTKNNKETDAKGLTKIWSDMEKKTEKIILEINQEDAICTAKHFLFSTVETKDSSKNLTDKIVDSAKCTAIKEHLINNYEEISDGDNFCNISTKGVEESSTGPNSDRNDNILEAASSITIQSLSANSTEKKSNTVTFHDCAQANIEKYQIFKDYHQENKVTKITNDVTITKKCHQCCVVKKCLYTVDNQEQDIFICSEDCFISLQEINKSHLKCLKIKNITKLMPFTRKCAECLLEIKQNHCTVLSWEIMEFCDVRCLFRYQRRFYSCCSHCGVLISINSLGKYCVRFGPSIQQFCNMKCLVNFRKERNVCTFCQNDMSKFDKFLSSLELKRQLKDFCSQLCLDTQNQKNNTVNNSRTVEIMECFVCNEETDIKIYLNQTNKNIIKQYMFCGISCFNTYKWTNLIFPFQCDFCKIYFNDEKHTQFALYNNNTLKNFCCKDCQTMYIITNQKITLCSWCKVRKYDFDMIKKSCNEGQPVIICSIRCLSLYEDSLNAMSTRKAKCDYSEISQPQPHLKNYCNHECMRQFQRNNNPDETTIKKTSDVAFLHGLEHKIKLNNKQKLLQMSTNLKTQVKQVIVKIPPAPVTKNAITLCSPILHSKGISCKLNNCSKETQTDETGENTILHPILVPIFVPTPLPRYSAPQSQPIPITLPIPIPILIPITQNCSQSITNELKETSQWISNNPGKSELLLTAGEKNVDKNNMRTEEHDNSNNTTVQNDGTQFASTSNNNFGNTLKVPMELNSMPNQQNYVDPENLCIRGSKRKNQRSKKPSQPAKRKQRITSNIELTLNKLEKSSEQQENLYSNQSLKCSVGICAWKQWIKTKNIEIKQSTNAGNLLKNDILQLTKDELNLYLCLFVQEIRKPDGTKYAPDTIYYLCLAIQLYLFKNNRDDNIFTDISYEKFTDCIYELSKNFSSVFRDSQFIVTRVEEEHLWESNQLGACSPQILLNTLMFFNTKYFYLSTVEEHMNLSFSRIIKYCKYTSTQQGAANNPGRNNAFLRYFPLKVTSNKCLEQHENKENSCRCPILLYKFYLSKCPESVKVNNESFYFLPEPFCSGESPRWYSTMPVSKNSLDKILHRVKMVKEINVALTDE